MDPVTIGLLIGAGTGLLKTEADKKKEARQRQLAATTQLYSPWTGLQANPVQEADEFGNLLKYSGAGASIGSGIARPESVTTSNAWTAPDYYSYGENGMPNYANRKQF